MTSFYFLSEHCFPMPRGSARVHPHANVCRASSWVKTCADEVQEKAHLTMSSLFSPAPFSDHLSTLPSPPNTSIGSPGPQQVLDPRNQLEPREGVPFRGGQSRGFIAGAEFERRQGAGAVRGSGERVQRRTKYAYDEPTVNERERGDAGTGAVMGCSFRLR